MIDLCRSHERCHQQRGDKEVWSTFSLREPGASSGGGFGVLATLDERSLPPRATSPQPPRHGDIVTYVREGALAFANKKGHTGIIRAGEFQRRTAMGRHSHRETNASHAASAHVFQLGFVRSPAELEPSLEQKRFSVADRREGLCVVASPNGRQGSLHIHQDAVVYAAMLRAGQHVVHELLDERSVWLHVVQGELTLQNAVLTTGDGAGVTAERAVALTARADSEILLVDVVEVHERAG